jgi:hypothetical protein
VLDWRLKGILRIAEMTVESDQVLMLDLFQDDIIHQIPGDSLFVSWGEIPNMNHIQESK